ncbi:MAG TPA: 2-phospho-L-lactate guanylyltransferase [Gaiellaceae bacterium]|nr:2-phospho-L-lactate guanylyltransferase [Gaiellaceae bacterium]
MDALVPLKRLDLAKTRLRERLEPAERARLMGTLLERTLRAALAAPSLERIVLVSSEPRAPELAAAHGIAWFDDRGLPWNDALAAATREAVRSGDVLILSADLPLVTTGDVEALVAAAPARGVAIARARDAGTNALVLRPAGAIATCFGIQGEDGSAQGHARLAAAAGLEAVIVDIPGLAADLDSPEDLDELL